MIFKYINKILFISLLIITIITYVIFLLLTISFIIVLFISPGKSWNILIFILIISLFFKLISSLFNNIQDNKFYNEDIKSNIITHIHNNNIEIIKGLNKIKQQLTKEDLDALKHYFRNNNEKFKIVDNYNKKSNLIKKIILSIYCAYIFYSSKLIVKNVTKIATKK